VASAHHERLDGRGYHRQLDGVELPWAARVLAVADMCEAMAAKRPYRDEMPWPKIQQILSRDAGKGVDPECLAALESWQDRNQLRSRVESQLCEVDRLLSEL
jgi:HD-GYP domain-containing protein (c-di-GMP phosphodiesterase class II)